MGAFSGVWALAAIAKRPAIAMKGRGRRIQRIEVAPRRFRKAKAPITKKRIR
jgi:hypothetical protein